MFDSNKKNQDEFVKTVAEDIMTTLSDSVDINFYFGPESAIYTFSSGEKIEKLKELHVEQNLKTV